VLNYVLCDSHTRCGCGGAGSVVLSAGRNGPGGSARDPLSVSCITACVSLPSSILQLTLVASLMFFLLATHTCYRNDAESEAMAVTAPTYVLEESLSSQQLWKHTAGTRPPQPVEERAFYEAMWAQNFARSQVKYHMPVEVLTATSPISLSPFADGNFEGNGARPEYSDYSVGPQHSHRLDKSRHEEVAFMKKLHDPQLARHIGLRVLQPHRQQPIIVNKKVKGSGRHCWLEGTVRFMTF